MYVLVGIEVCWHNIFSTFPLVFYASTYKIVILNFCLPVNLFSSDYSMFYNEKLCWNVQAFKLLWEFWNKNSLKLLGNYHYLLTQGKKGMTLHLNKLEENAAELWYLTILAHIEVRSKFVCHHFYYFHPFFRSIGQI